MAPKSLESIRMAPMPVLPEFNQDRVAKPQTSRSNRSIFFYITAFVGISWLAYALLSKPSPAASEITMTTPEGYGQNAKPEFKDVIQIMDLPSQYVPETGKNRGLGRLVVVGDVHGMKDSLVELLKKVGFKEKHDHLILAGDIISKGPDSVGVVDLAMKLGATVVRGNHEDRILLAHADMVAKHMDIDEPGPSEPEDKKIDEMEELSFSHGDYKDRKLVKELGEKRIKWLKQSPVILRVGPLGKMGEVVVVHAGLAPGVALEKQDPTLVMTMRTIKDGVPSEERDGKGWMKAWNNYQKKLPKKDRSTVIYGHDSKRGLQMEKYSFGIDTGCLKGGKLTAVVIEGGHSDHKHKLHHVKCKDGRQK